MLWNIFSSFWLEVLVLTSSDFPEEPAKRVRREVIRTAPRLQAGEATELSRALLEPSHVLQVLLSGPSWPLSALHSTECFDAYQCPWQHRCCTPRSTCCPPERSRVGGCPQQCRSCTATAARVWRSKEAVRTKGHSKGWQSPYSWFYIAEPVGSRSLSDPHIGAVAAYPFAFMCSLPPGQRHVVASQRPCL